MNNKTENTIASMSEEWKPLLKAYYPAMLQRLFPSKPRVTPTPTAPMATRLAVKTKSN